MVIWMMLENVKPVINWAVLLQSTHDDKTQDGNGYILSRNRPNYKSTSPKTIAEAIKFLNLSPYNSGSPRNHERFQTKPRATKIIVIQHNTTLVTIVHK
jgi:hypothetical protein